MSIEIVKASHGVPKFAFGMAKPINHATAWELARRMSRIRGTNTYVGEIRESGCRGVSLEMTGKGEDWLVTVDGFVGEALFEQWERELLVHNPIRVTLA